MERLQTDVFVSHIPYATEWSGAFQGNSRTIVVPEFWGLAALSMGAIPWVVIGRKIPPIIALTISLAGYAALGLGGASVLRGTTMLPNMMEHGPAPAFYVAVATAALALAILIFGPKEPARVDPA
jgi:hypothetical protein